MFFGNVVYLVLYVEILISGEPDFVYDFIKDRVLEFVFIICWSYVIVKEFVSICKSKREGDEVRGVC